jgi:hypothetical protein
MSDLHLLGFTIITSNGDHLPFSTKHSFKIRNNTVAVYLDKRLIDIYSLNFIRRIKLPERGNKNG